MEALELGQCPLTLLQAPHRTLSLLSDLGLFRRDRGALDPPAFRLGQAERKVGCLEREETERDRCGRRVEVELAAAKERRAWQRAGCEPGAEQGAEGEA